MSIEKGVGLDGHGECMTKSIYILFQVERHCNRLDADLVKFEEEAPLGRERITAQPGLAPSARSLLREVARDKVARAYERDRKEGKVDKRGELI